MKATLKKIESIKAMFNNYKALEERASELQDRMFDESGKYNATVHLEWCEVYDEEKKMEKTIKRNVRSLAADLGFVIKKKDFESLMSTWEDTFDDLEYQFNKAMKALHELGWNGWYSKSLENEPENNEE